jgi:hypothetical protein
VEFIIKRTPAHVEQPVGFRPLTEILQAGHHNVSYNDGNLLALFGFKAASNDPLLFSPDHILFRVKKLS